MLQSATSSNRRRFRHIFAGSGMIFMATNSLATDRIDSYESTKPSHPCFFAFVELRHTISMSCWSAEMLNSPHDATIRSVKAKVRPSENGPNILPFAPFQPMLRGQLPPRGLVLRILSPLDEAEPVPHQAPAA